MTLRTTFALVALAGVPLGGCLRSTAFTCSTNAACGATGRCESTGYCSIPDQDCGGNRYVASAGAYAGQCVNGTTVDAAVDGLDGPPDAPGCPAEFAALPTVTTNHVYKAIATGRDWGQQQAACVALSPRAYLAIPDDATELAALATVQTPPLWVGIQRVGAGFQTVAGVDATFLPWQGGAPDNTGQRNCVTALSTTEIQTETCTQNNPAVCECAP